MKIRLIKDRIWSVWKRNVKISPIENEKKLVRQHVKANMEVYRNQHTGSGAHQNGNPVAFGVIWEKKRKGEVNDFKYLYGK